MRVAIVRMHQGAKSEPFITFETEFLSRYQPILVAENNDCFALGSKIAALLGLVHQCKRLPINIVHSHFGPDAQFGELISKRNKVAHVISLHGYDACYSTFQLFKLKRLRYLTYACRRRSVLRRADIILCCSEFLLSRVKRLGFVEPHAIVHYLGVDLARINRIRGSSPGHRRRQRGSIVCVGRLVPIKGQDILLQAVQRIVQHYPEATLTLVGEGPRLTHLRRLARKLQIEPHVRFAGAKSHDDALKIMSQADVVVVPSKRIGNIEEAFGLAAAEAMALGVPVIATNTGGLPEVLDNGRLGRLVAAHPDALAKSIIDSLQTRDEAQIDAARLFVEKKFDAKKQLEALERLFDRVISHNNSGSFSGV